MSGHSTGHQVVVCPANSHTCRSCVFSEWHGTDWIFYRPKLFDPPRYFESTVYYVHHIDIFPNPKQLQCSFHISCTHICLVFGFVRGGTTVNHKSISESAYCQTRPLCSLHQYGQVWATCCAAGSNALHDVTIVAAFTCHTWLLIPCFSRSIHVCRHRSQIGVRPSLMV